LQDYRQQLWVVLMFLHDKEIHNAFRALVTKDTPENEREAIMKEAIRAILPDSARDDEPIPRECAPTPQPQPVQVTPVVNNVPKAEDCTGAAGAEKDALESDQDE